MAEPTFEFKPAADLGLSEAQRLRSVKREPGLVTYLSHRAMSGLLWLYFRGAHRLTVEHAGRLPRSTPFVLIANHGSHLDALIMAAGLPRRLRSVTFPVAAGDVFFTSVTKSAVTALLVNALPLWRKKVTTHALAELRDRLAARECGLILFPEGARSRDGGMIPFKPGIGMLVAGTSVPVVPCYIRGAFEAFPPGKKLPRLVKITMRVGEPINFESTGNDREGWTEVAAKLRGAVDALAAESGV